MNQPDRAAVDPVKLKRWIAECDPRKPLDPASDRRYFDFEKAKFAGKPVELRGEEHPIDDLFTGITYAAGNQSCQLFSGFSGTGKSTELRRLTHRLTQAGYTVLLADAQDYHDLNHELTIEDLMVILTGAFGDAASAQLGREVTGHSYWQRLKEFLSSEVELSGVDLSLGVTDLKIGLKHAKSFWVKVREALTTAPSQLRDHSHGFIRETVEALATEHRNSAGVVFVLDSLERLTAPLTDFRPTMQSVIRILTEYSQFLTLPDCHVVYTIPPYVQLISPSLRDRYDHTTLVLPAIKVRERGENGLPYPPGVEALVELVARRIPIDEVFGERRDLLERLILYSGGHVRMLILFLRDLLFKARSRGLPPTDRDVERVVQPFREQAGFAILRESVPLLERIRRQGTLEGLKENEHAYLAHFMDTYVVLCYRNGDGWYEVHPLVDEIVDRLAAQIGDERASARADEPER